MRANLPAGSVRKVGERHAKGSATRARALAMIIMVEVLTRARATSELHCQALPLEISPIWNRLLVHLAGDVGMENTNGKLETDR